MFKSVVFSEKFLQSV